MTLRLVANLERPDYEVWQSHFPSGVGGSIFGSPEFQRMMLREHGMGWRQRMLRVRGPSSDLNLPVLVRRNYQFRYQLALHPIAYYVLPIELDVVTAEIATAVHDAAAVPGVSQFTWWLPPWTPYLLDKLDAGRYGDNVIRSTIDTYVIRCETDHEAYMAECVSKNRRYEARVSLGRGLEIVDTPAPSIVDEYYDLYRRVYVEQGWSGHAFSRDFFHDAATRLGEGARLLVMRLDNRVVGGGVLLVDRTAVHYYQGTTDRAVRGVFPHSVLYSEAVKLACARGLRLVNLGGVNHGNDSLINFKKAWGAQRVDVQMVRWHCSLTDVGRIMMQSVARSASTRIYKQHIK